MSATLNLDGKSLAITAAEAVRLHPLIARLQELSSHPFALDRGPVFQPPPPHVITPSRIRAAIRRSLEELDRATELERRIVEALRLGGVPFLDLEAGRATLANVVPKAPEAIGRSRWRSPR